VLLFTLRRGWPVAIPLATAIVAVGIGLAVIGLLGRLVYIPDEAPTLGTMLGLGVGIDYALFLVTRHRTLLRRGFAVPDAVGRTAGTAGAGMVFAGATLLAAVSGLALTGISFLAWLGYSAAIVVALALAAALTLVPALMGLMGLRVLPRAQQRQVAAGELAHAGSDEDLDRGAWARIADAVTGRPWPWAIGATTVLLVMAMPMLSMQFQQVDSSALPDETTAHRAGDLIRESFGPGWSGPLAVVAQLHRAAAITDADEDAGGGGQDDGGAAGGGSGADAATDPRTRDPRLVALTAELAGTAGITEVSDPIVSTDGGVVIWRAIPATGPSDKATEALVHELRTQVLPAATAAADMTPYVGGVTAARTDLSLRIADRLLPFILGVASFSFLLLMVAYRSLVIPLKAAAMNLLSISAAYGVVVAVFQWGWGAPLIGLDGPVPIESYVPMMMFAVLFGLSMDYEVFLLTAFSEHYQRTGSIPTAVRRGLADTGQLITAAALIMVVVFASFILPDNAVVKMFGVGLATAVLVDATVVRCVLVPSLMVLAARWTWWLPGWLDRALPHLHVEGDPAQLATVGTGRVAQPGDSRPAVGATGFVVGALAGWLAGVIVTDTTAVGISAPTMGAAIAVAAGSGAALAALPRATRGADSGLAVRLLVMLAAALGSAAVAMLLRGLTPATASTPVLQSAVALLVPVALAGWRPLRRHALPIALGSVAMTTALAAAIPSVLPTGPALPLGSGVVPARAAAVTARAAAAVGRRVGRAEPVGPGEGPRTPAEREPAERATESRAPVADEPDARVPAGQGTVAR
jgi:RND superfamily putative drug exporter